MSVQAGVLGRETEGGAKDMAIVLLPLTVLCCVVEVVVACEGDAMARIVRL